MNYNKLKYFYEICKTMNLTKTAEELFISQSSLSKSVKDLEDFFGTALFRRTNRCMVLTEAGEVLRDECNLIFGRENEIINHVRRAALQKTHIIRLGHLMFNSFYKLPSLIQTYQKIYPLHQIELIRYHERTDLLSDLYNNKIDLALNIFTPEDITAELGFKKLEEQYLSIIVSTQNPLSQLDIIDLADLKDENFIFLGCNDHSSEYRFAKGWCQRCGFTPNILQAYNEIETVLLMVQCNAGITLLSKFAPIEHMNHLKNITLANSPLIYSGLFWNKKNLSKNAEIFMQFLYDSFCPNVIHQ